MKFEELFDQRSIVAMKLKDYIRERGFTKVSFAKKAEISRPTLDKILNGSIDNKSTFDKHLQKVLAVLNISVDDLVFFEAKPKSDIVDVVYSENAPKDYRDSYDYQKSARERLNDVFASKTSIDVSYKSNDTLLCQMFRNGMLSLGQIDTLRCDERVVVYTRSRDDKSTALVAKRTDNQQFKALLQDMNVQIIF